MDKSRVLELERMVSGQKEQLSRYEKRIHDVVTAYKGLLKEKEALEASLLSTVKKDDSEPKDASETPASVGTEAVANEPATSDQLATVMNSLATLSAEKSRMEMSFQRDKKLLRQEMSEKDKRIRELEEKANQNVSKTNLELEGLKSKLILERHARDKETNDQLVMIKELQKLLSDERQLKDNLEMQLNSLKVAFSSSASQQVSQKKFDELQAEVARLKQMEVDLEERTSSGMSLDKLQELMANMKKQHASALKLEQARTVKVEEELRKISLVHEERVANLEARLAELSNTVGNYDRLRQQDQESIQGLKEKLLDASSRIADPLPVDTQSSIEDILGEIERLKLALLKENAKMKHPVDVSRLFSLPNDHTKCRTEQDSLNRELAACKAELETMQEDARVQKSHIINLQEKITVLNKNIEDQEIELKDLTAQHATEQEKWKHNMEVAVRVKTEEMQQHLQKQRERSLNLLSEKENEIKALKTSFDLFIPVEPNTDSQPTSPTTPASVTSFATDGKTTNILHYVHELARKDVEISSLRKSKHSAESAMRQAIKDKITSQEELHDQIANLEEQVGRLERCQTREGANLEYLKNVILNFLITKDMESKRHMVNAIGTLLKFSPSELKMVNNYFYSKK